MIRRNCLLLTWIFLLFFNGVMMSQNAVLTTGDNVNGAGGSVSFSVGQVAYRSYSGESGSVNQGVQQPYIIIMVDTDDPSVNVSAVLYPNPANESAHLKLTEGSGNPAVTDNFSFELYDMNGNLLRRDDIRQELTTIPMSEYPAATYIVKVMQYNDKVKTFKIFKTN